MTPYGVYCNRGLLISSKVAIEQIESICNIHGIVYESSQRITVGFSNEVHKINDDFILKIFQSGEKRKYETELTILGSPIDFAKPKVIGSSGNDNPIERYYILMEFIPGKNLGGLWHIASDKQRENIIANQSSILKKINSMSPSLFSNEAHVSWPEMLRNRAYRLTDDLDRKNIITVQQVSAVKKRFDSYMKALKTDSLRPVNWDIHFDNLIIDDNFTIRAMIDLENVEIASLDYPLFIIRDLMREPHRYMTEENEKFANPKDYKKLWEWYKKYYPEMFEFESLDTRIEAYELINSLDLLQKWSHNSKLIEKFERQICYSPHKTKRH